MRTKGMGLKIMKFHAIVHLCRDILLYGVPYEFDTGSNESHHKESKHAAHLTQRKESTFNLQTGKRLAEFAVLDFAMQEINHDRKVWTYFDGAVEENYRGNMLENVDSEDEDEDEDDDAEMEDVVPEVEDDESDQGDAEPESEPEVSESEEEELIVTTGGTKIHVFEDPDDDDAPSFRMLGRSKHAPETVWVQDVINFLVDLQNKVLAHIPQTHLPICTQQKRGNHTFYGHPNHRGNGPWKDWAIIDWGRDWGKLPSHIWCFVMLSNMPKGRDQIEHGGVYLQDGVFAVVEVASYVPIPDDDRVKMRGLRSDLFIPLDLEVEGMDEEGDVTGRKFYLASTDAFVGPCCVIPDIGGPTNRYFQVKPRSEWVDEFVVWLKQPHKDDQMHYDHQEQEAQK